jgi:L-2-hydroxycarboxylate dehydrogenase (NAD+)
VASEGSKDSCEETLIRGFTERESEGARMSGHDAGERVVDLAALRACMERALEADGMSSSHAAETADVLLDAELRGYDDHGVWFMGEVHKWLKSGALNPAPNIQVVRETESSLLLDGDGGCGVAASFQAMRWCVERAAERGIATAGIQRSGHFIAAAPFPTWAAKQGFIAMAAANVVPLMPAPGGRSKSLGTNPFCFAAPTGLEHPLVFDMATSAIAGFKVRIMAQQGKSVEEGLVYNADGRPTTDPGDLDRGGSLAPVGGHKGFGLALMVDVLAGVMTGAQFGQNAGVVNGKEGHFFLALDPAIFVPRQEFTRRMDELLRWVKSGEKIEGVEEIVYPGERGQRRAAELTASGQVPLNAVAWQTLESICAETGVPLPA